MALIDLKFYSVNLKMQTSAMVIIPEGQDVINSDSKNQIASNYPCLYLLHGYEQGDQAHLDRCWVEKGMLPK